MEEHTPTDAIDYSKPLKDRTQEEIARALAANWKVDRPDDEFNDLLFFARKMLTEHDNDDYYAE